MKYFSALLGAQTHTGTHAFADDPSPASCCSTASAVTVRSTIRRLREATEA